MEITQKEKRLLALACNGYLTVHSAKQYYSTKEYAQLRIKALILRGLVEFDPVRLGYFRITQKGMDVLVQ